MSDAQSRSTILIVEDEPALVELFAEWLDGVYDVRTASTRAAAVDQLDDTVDVVTLDRQLPDCSGKEILTDIRARGIECSVVMVTGDPADSDISERTVAEYLVKPVSRDDLQEAVNAVTARMAYATDG